MGLHDTDAPVLLCQFPQPDAFATMPVNAFFQNRRQRAEADALAINSRTLHQYYSTVQSEVPPEHELNYALARRRVRVLQARQRRRAALWWLGAFGLALVAWAAVLWG